jgi:soluble lytic murein transglycosylase
MNNSKTQISGDVFGGETESSSGDAFRPHRFWQWISLILLILIAIGAAVGGYYFNQYWIHRFDPIIEKQAEIYRLDHWLVWSVIYQETYFRPTKIGAAGEVGLMQITPTVAKDWAQETGLADFEREMQNDHVAALSEPERNIQIGCWYLEKMREKYSDTNAPEARALAAYNAGASRVAEWDKAAPLSETEFIERIDIASTRAYVTEILQRWRSLKNENKKQ